METMKIAGQNYPITGNVVHKAWGNIVPLVDIPMMSDYKWQLRCLQSRLENPELYHTRVCFKTVKVTKPGYR